MADKEHCDVLVIGGGPSGMMAAITASGRGRKVILAEKNEKLGKKLYITGKGRCNLTNACLEHEIFGNIISNGKFMYSSIKRFSNMDVMDFFERRGVKLKTERGERVFPESDRSSDVIRTLEGYLNELNADIRLNTAASKLIISGGVCSGAVLRSKNGNTSEISAESVIVATGGLSYPMTGSTGDGYGFARDAGIAVTELNPGLVPLETEGDICSRLQGLSLKNVKISISEKDRLIYECNDPGEMIFTHFGVSGPLILTASSAINPAAFQSGLVLHIDLKPALGYDELDDRIVRDFREVSNREFKNSLKRLLPSKLIPVITELSGIYPYKQVNSVTSEERSKLVRLIKDLSTGIRGTRGFDEAIITKGGVSVKDLDPKTFESKRVKGLYFAGEIVDVDAYTGGFNLQIAWSSGYAAGSFS